MGDRGVRRHRLSPFPQTLVVLRPVLLANIDPNSTSTEPTFVTAPCMRWTGAERIQGRRCGPTLPASNNLTQREDWSGSPRSNAAHQHHSAGDQEQQRGLTFAMTPDAGRPPGEAHRREHQ